MPPFQRKNIRLAPQNYRGGRRLYFITLCFHNRRPRGANPRIANWLIDKLRTHAAACEFFIHAFCVMPDHIHVLAAASSETSNLIKFVEAFKQDTAFEFVRKSDEPLWQLKYYDRILRAGDSADAVAWYIWLNPVRQGLCSKPTDYPFLGSFTELGAKLLKGSATAEWIPPWKKNAVLKTTALH
jgi:putative transposase